MEPGPITGYIGLIQTAIAGMILLSLACLLFAANNTSRHRLRTFWMRFIVALFWVTIYLTD